MPRAYKPRDNRNPIMYDIVRGQGGIAGGNFTVNSTDTLAPVTYQYVAPGYITGQGGYITGDLGSE